MDRSVQNGSVHLGSHTNRDKTALYDCEQLVSGLSVTLYVLMQNNPTAHIEPLTFWQCACGGPDLSNRDCQHMISCPECQMFGMAINDALNDIENACGQRYIAVS